MKNHLLTSITLFLFFTFAIGQLSSQNQSSHSNNTFWIGIESGLVSSTIEKNELSGHRLNISANYNKGIHLFSLQRSKMSFDNGLTQLFGAIFFQKTPLYTSEMKEISMMYGFISSPATLRFHGQLGMSSLSGNSGQDIVGNSRIKFSEIGLPLKIGLNLNTKYIGVGLSYYKNFNSYTSMSGVSISLHVGPLK